MEGNSYTRIFMVIVKAINLVRASLSKYDVNHICYDFLNPLSKEQFAWLLIKNQDLLNVH